MNKVYNVIWSSALNALVVVAEGTKSRSKSTVRGLRVLIAFLLLTPAAGMAATLPEGGMISIGEGTIVNAGNGQMTIKQTTDKLGINWQSFNVGEDGHVIFDQPNKNSVALNRVIGTDGSSILGKIDSNGQVFVINPNGVVFGKDSQVNVGGIVASTLNITDQDFKDGNYRFDDQGKAGAVINLGVLNASEGGYVALIGKNVKNQGVIKAKLGSAALAAGGAVTLDFAGDGLLNIQVDKGTVDALAENKGLIKADGGSVLMTARATNELTQTVVNNEGIIEAQTVNNRAGKIFLDGGFDGNGINVAGTLDASAPTNGNGGLIETSSSVVMFGDDLKITTLANNGTTGNWLIDPLDFQVVSGSGVKTSTSIGATTLIDALNSSNVELATSSSAGSGGTIYIDAPVAWNANTKLTLTAAKGISVANAITVNGDSGGLALNYDPAYDFDLTNAPTAKITFNGNNNTFALNNKNFSVIGTAAQLQALSSGSMSANYVIGRDIDASDSVNWDGGKGFSPIGTSSAAYTGQIFAFGGKISNLTIKRPDQDNVGLVGYGSGALLKGLNISGTVKGKNNVGLLAGSLVETSKILTFTKGNQSAGTQNIVSGTVSGTDNVGGLVGSANTSSVIAGSQSAVNVTGNDHVGGVVGFMENADSNYLGSSGTVRGNTYVGGIHGTAAGGNHSWLQSTGSIIGATETGGVIGAFSDSTLSWADSVGSVYTDYGVAGGLVGNSYNIIYSQTYSTASVHGNSVGGLIGLDNASTINSSFSMGNVTGIDLAGGLIASAINTKVNNSYSSATPTASLTGGLIGSAEHSTLSYTYANGKAQYGLYSNAANAGNTATNSYWDMGLSQTSTSAGGVGKTSAEMKSLSTFASWDINNNGVEGKTWRLYEGKSAPILVFRTRAALAAPSASLTYAGRNLTDADVPTSETLYGFQNMWKGMYDGSLGSLASGGTAIRNAGSYILDNRYSTQFGLNINQSTPTTLTVNKKVIAVAVASSTGKVYDGTTAASVTLSSSDVIGSDSVLISGTAAYTDKKAEAGKAVTVNGFVLNGADAANYSVSTASLSTTSTIAKAALAISATAADKTYDSTVAASTSLTDSRVGSDALTITKNDGVFSDKNAGSSKLVTVSGINVTGADAENYTWNATATTRANIAKANLAVTATASDKVYDGSTAANVSLDYTKIGADDLSVSALTHTFDTKNAGASKVVTVGLNVGGADAENYTWNTLIATSATITKANLVIAATASNKVYDATTAATTALTDNRILGDDLTFSANSTFSDKNAGAGKIVTVDGITLGGADSGNYAWNTSTTTMADIAKAQLQVAIGVASKDYDATTSALTFLSDSRMAGDQLEVKFASSAFDNKNAGLNKTVTADGITVTGTDAGNYEWASSATALADIGRVNLAITATGVNKTYDGTSDASVTLSANRLGTDSLTITTDDATFTDKNAGTGKQISVSGINVSGADAANYLWDATSVAYADIAKANLNVTATANAKVYDGTTNVSTALSDNRISGDVLNITSINAFADKNAGVSKVVNITDIDVTGTDAGNYSWNASTSTAATILKASLEIAATAENKIYDASANATTHLTDNRIAGDDLSISVGSSTFADKNAGLAKDVTVAGLSLTGADAGNYSWNTVALAKADIAKASLGITATAQDKVYDGSNSASISLSGSRLGSDDIDLHYSTATFSDKNAALGKTVTVSGVRITGSDSSNYTWGESTQAYANISKANLAVTTTAQNKVYDGSAVATTSLADNRIGSDDIILSSTSSLFSDKNAGVGKAVTVSGISATGADAVNYTLNTAAATTADISKAALGITVAAASKDYDGTANADVFLTDKRISGDSLDFEHSQATFSNKNAGTGKTVTVGGITVTGADAQNYEWSTIGTATADIGRAVLAITASGVNKTYDGTTDATTTFADNRIGTDDLTVSADTISFTDKNADTGKQISISGIKVTGTDALNYLWDATGLASADITKATLNVTATAANKTYDGTTGVSTSLSDNRIGADDLVVTSRSALSDKNAGLGKTVNVDTINVTGADARNYFWNDTASATADIAKANLQIDATATSKTYDGSATAQTKLTDNRISGDSLTIAALSSSFSDKNAGLNKAVTVSGLSVTGADAGNYAWSSAATTTADISKANLVVSASAQSRVYDATVLATTTLTDNRVGADNLVIASSGSAFSDKNAGASKTVTVSGITVTGADAKNYSWAESAFATADISKANLAVTASASNKVYDGSSAATTTLSDSRLGADKLTLSKTGSTFSDKNAGTAKTVTVSGITAIGDDAKNYVWDGIATTTANISKAQLTVSVGAGSKDYDSTNTATVFLSDNRITGDSLDLGHGEATFADKNAGVGKTVSVKDISVTGTDSDNYVWNKSGTAKADIGKAILSITATGINKTYDGTVNGSVVLNDNRLGADALTVNASDVSFVDKNAASGKQMSVSGITVTGADSSNYLWDATSIASADITKASLTVSALASNKVYDGSTLASTALADNRIAGDDLELTKSSASFSDKNVGTGKSVIVNGIVVSGSDARNYVWNDTAATTAAITKANLVVDATGVNKAYDSTSAATAALSDNRVSGDSLNVAYANAAFTDKNAGVAKTVNVAGISVTGSDAGNYTWNTTDTTTADIAKAALTVTASGVDKTYDGTVAATTLLTDSRFANDDLSLVAGSASFSDKNAGTGKLVSVSGISASGRDAGNYTWSTTAQTSANIAKASLSVTASGQSKVYDTTTSATVAYADNRAAGDQLSITGSASFADKNVGIAKAVNVSGINVTGSDASNYAWNSSTSTAANITKASLVISAVANDKTYDGSTVAQTSLDATGLGSDKFVLSSTASNFSDKNAGAAKAVTVSGLSVSGADAGNYQWNESASTTATINKAVLTVSGVAHDKTYDGTATAAVTMSDNRIGSDNLKITAAHTTFADKNAGTGKLVSIDGIAVAGADASNYNWNATATASADIAKATLIVSATTQDKSYNGTTAAITTLTDNRIVGDNLVVGTTGSAFSDKNAGSDKLVTINGISLTGADALNYMTAGTASSRGLINKAVLNVTAAAADKTYNGTTGTSATLSDNRIAGDSLNLAYGAANFSDKNAGAEKTVSVSGINVSGVDALNYAWNTLATDTASIDKASLVISATGLNKTYDGSTTAAVDLADNRFMGDQLILAGITAAFVDKNAGASKLISVTGLTVTGIDAQNYTWNKSATTIADITKRALQVIGSGVTKTYDTNTFAQAALTDNRVAGDDLTLTATNASFADKNAGKDKVVTVEGISVSGADAGNYTWANSAIGTGTISKAALTVTATASDKVYDGSAVAESSYSDNRLAGDVLTVNAARSAFSDKNAGIGKAVTVSGITLAGADANNYSVNSVADATATISKAALSVGANASDKVYDGTAAAQVALTDNRVAGDNIIVANAIARFGDKNAGSNKSVAVEGISVGGSDAGNYTWNSATNTKANIDKAQLLVSGVVQEKVYDATTSATLVSLSDNRVIGDELTIKASGASFVDKNAGSKKEARIQDVTVSGADSGNYSLSSVATTAAEITKAFMQLAAVGQNKSYDGTSKATVSITDERMVGDQVGVTVGSASFDTKNVGDNKVITASNLALTGVDAGNYTIVDALTTHADVSKANLIVAGNRVKKVKGQKDPLLTWKVQGGTLFAGDTFLGSLSRASGEELGTYGIDQGTLTAGSNYNLTFTPSEMTIVDAPQETPVGYESAIKSMSKGMISLPSVKRVENITQALGYNMLNLGMKLPEEGQVDDAPVSIDKIEVIR